MALIKKNLPVLFSVNHFEISYLRIYGSATHITITQIHQATFSLYINNCISCYS